MIKSVILTTSHDATIRSEPVIWPPIAESTKIQVKFVAAVRVDFENSLKRKSDVIALFLCSAVQSFQHHHWYAATHSPV